MFLFSSVLGRLGIGYSEVCYLLCVLFLFFYGVWCQALKAVTVRHRH